MGLGVRVGVRVRVGVGVRVRVGVGVRVGVRGAMLRGRGAHHAGGLALGACHDQRHPLVTRLGHLVRVRVRVRVRVKVRVRVRVRVAMVPRSFSAYPSSSR